MEQNNTEPKKIQVWLPVLLSLMMVGGMFIGLNLQPSSPQTKIIIENEQTSSQLGQGRIEELIRYIEAKYVDEVESDKMVEKAIKSLMKDLDPHSNYLSAEQVQQVNEDLQGNFQGIGVEFMMLDDTIIVIKPIEDGPSEAVGILAGDKIIEISDTLVAGAAIDITKIMRMLRGERDTEVEVGVQREGETDLRRFTIKRGKIPVYSVDLATMLDEKTGYIRLNRFSATTYNEFMKGLEKLVEEKGMEDLVIDLRGNPGGYLQEATKILSQLFREKKELLVYTEGRATDRNDYNTTGQNFFDVGKITVLVDESSASASEIMAGAIQDLDRGTIIGRRSFGKGLVQEQYALKDGSALRLTVARYYTPSGRSIQRPYKENAGYDDDFDARYKRGELVDETKIERNDSLVFETRAGRLVYGGGGITPDIFVPIDTVLFNTYYNELQQHIPSFAYRYYWKNKQLWMNTSFEEFKQNFEISEAVLAEFLTFTESKKVERKSADLFQLKDVLKNDLKIRVAKYLYNEEGAFVIQSTNDNMIREALKVMNSPNPLVIKNNSEEKLEEKDF